jgi:Transposase IS66 family
VLPGRIAPDWRDDNRDAGHRTVAAQGEGYSAASLCLQSLRYTDCSGAGARTADRRRHGNRSVDRACVDLEILRLPAFIRQSKIFQRQGIMLDRSTLGDWIGRACWWLRSLYDRIVSHVMSADKIFADDTSVPVLDPGRGQTKTGRFWCYAIDDRPWRGPLPPAAAYVYAVDRKGIRPAGHVEDFRSTMQVDGYTGFGRVAKQRADASVRLVFCWKILVH